jgi:ABC-type spermidine/putrescine transport system permease subunit II
VESLARLVAIILSTALGAGIVAIVLWRKPPRNIIARAFFTVLMIPVICIGIFLATLSVGIGVRALGLAIFIAAVMAIKSLLSRK